MVAALSWGLQIRPGRDKLGELLFRQAADWLAFDVRPWASHLVRSGRGLIDRSPSMLLAVPLHTTGHAAASLFHPAIFVAGATASADPLGSELCSLVAGFSWSVCPTPRWGLFTP